MILDYFKHNREDWIIWYIVAAVSISPMISLVYFAFCYYIVASF